MSLRGRPYTGGAANSRLSNSLHRCAIVLCSNQAVAEVCSMHLSRNGQGAVIDGRIMGLRGTSPSSAGIDDSMTDDRTSYYIV
ncbi:hypothetical protein Plhal703r1_c19g0085821 [Plasmopara halstedii]